MKLQKNTVLALYSVLEFAANPGRHHSAAEVAQKYRVSPHHLAKVLRTLGRAGLVGATRGVGGGYRFAGNAKRLTLMDVIELFEDISAPRRADVLEQLDHVHQRQALGVTREAVAPAHPARRADQSGTPERAQDLRQVMGRNAVLLRDFGGRVVASRVGGELEHAIEREHGVLLQLHLASVKGLSRAR